MRTVDFTPLWTVRRPRCFADVTCELSVLLDATDTVHHAVRVTLNGQPVYEVLHARRADAELACDDARRDLMAAGWRDDLGWMSSAAAPVRAA
jgi:hypothetical protein